MILKRLELGMWASNCYIVGDETSKQGLVVDPGEEPDEIINTIKRLGLDIKIIVATHGHADHVGAIAEVKEATGAPVAIHSHDAGSLRGGGMFSWGRTRGSSADRLLEDGDSIDVNDLHFEVLHTPGHTSGGICLYGHEVVFTGDTLFYHSVGRTDIGGGTHEELIRSIYKKLLPLPDKTVVYPGHGPPSTIGAERHGNPFLRR